MPLVQRLRHRRRPQPAAPTPIPPAETAVAGPSSQLPTAAEPATRTAKLRYTFTCETPANAVSITPDATFHAIATDARANAGTNPATIRIYETSTRATRASVTAHAASVLGVALSADASLGLSCDHAGLVTVWDARDGARRAVLLGHRGRVGDVALTPLGGRAASAGVDSTVRLWDVPTHTSTHVLTGHGRSVTSVALCRGGELVLSTGYDCMLRGWDARTGRQAFAVAAAAGFVTDCAADADGLVLASCAEDGRLLVWDARALKCVHELETPGKLFGCALTMDGARAVACGGEGFVRAWDMRNGEQFPPLRGHEAARVRRCAISADGVSVVTAGFDKTARLFELGPTSDGARTAVGCAVAEVTTEIEGVFFRYMNEGLPLETFDVARAIETDFNQKHVSKISDVYIGHLCVRTLCARGAEFSEQDLGGPVNSGSFFFQKLYHKLSELSPSYRSQEFAAQILNDAQRAGILSRADVNSILGDTLSNQYTRDLISELRTIMGQVYEEVTSRIASMESRMRLLSNELASLHATVDRIDTQLERAAKVQRYTNLVKFGLALIPFVGSAAMAFADGSVSLIMSLDLESAVELATELVSTAGQAAVDHHVATDGNAPVGEVVQEPEDVQAVRLVQQVLSDEFLRRLDKQERTGMVKALEEQFGRGLYALREEVNGIVAEYETLQDDDAEADANGAPVRTVDYVHPRNYQSVDEVSLSSMFTEIAGGAGTISHHKATQKLDDLLKEHPEYSNLGEDAMEEISEVLLAKMTEEGQLKIGQSCFVAAGIATVERMSLNATSGANG